MATAAARPEFFSKGILSMHKFLALIDEHNNGVQDDHAICVKLDADASLTDADYEAQLAALEIPYTGYTPTEPAVPGLEFDPHHLSEDFMRKAVEQLNARILDIRTITAKLDADIAGGAYAAMVLSERTTALGEAFTAAADDPALHGGDTSGIAGRLEQALVTAYNRLAQDWHDVTAGLDVDAGVGTTTYEATITARTIPEV